MKMKTKRIIFGLMATVTLIAVSCEPNTTAQEDELYEVGIDKSSIVLKEQSSDIDKSSIVLKSSDIDKSSIVLKGN